MKYTHTYLILSFLVYFTLSSCHEIPPTIPDLKITGEKTVVIEDFTGVRCTNCPTAAQAIKSLASPSQFGDNIIPISIHAPKFSTFTRPLDSSKYDFRIEEADAIAELVLSEVLGLPSAMFDRYDFHLGSIEGHIVNSVGNYSSAVLERINIDPKVLISIENKYDTTMRELTTIASIRPTVDVQGDTYITFMLIENGIVDYQTDKQEILSDYVHNHVLRDVYSHSPIGDPITQDLKEGKLIKITRTTQIDPMEAGKSWNNPQNMEAVVFVHRRGEELTCLQAAIAPILD